MTCHNHFFFFIALPLMKTKIVVTTKRKTKGNTRCPIAQVPSVRKQPIAPKITNWIRFPLLIILLLPFKGVEKRAPAKMQCYNAF